MHSIPIVKEEEKEYRHAHLGDLAQLYHSYHILSYLFNQGNFHESFILFKSEKLQV